MLSGSEGTAVMSISVELTWKKGILELIDKWTHASIASMIILVVWAKQLKQNKNKYKNPNPNQKASLSKSTLFTSSDL
jgi:hypothetical protein